MNNLLNALKPKERRGSKPRCHLLTHGAPEAVAEHLTALTYPFATVSPSDTWMPQGFADVTEARLPKASRLLPPDARTAFDHWWLAVAANAETPNWDIASTCTVDGRPGILLVEAKAHDRELRKEEGGKKFDASRASQNSQRNHARIGSAIAESSTALEDETDLPWTRRSRPTNLNFVTGSPISGTVEGERRRTAMHLNIELPDALGAVIKAQAQAAGVSPDQFVSRVLQTTLSPESHSNETAKPFETGYGMLAKYGAAPSAEEIDENRRDMFRNFGQEF